MGITATAIGCLVGGALIGGGTVAVGHHIRQKRIKEEEERKKLEYYKILQEMNLRNKKVKFQIYKY